MKLCCHYLRFEWLHWRWLLIAMWSLLAAAAGLAGLTGLETGPTAALSRLETAMQTCWVLAGGCALVIVVLTGHGASPVPARSWTLTRPRRAGSLGVAQILLCIGGIALPAAAAHGLSLQLLDFTGATVLAESGIALLTVGAVAAGLMLWAFLCPARLGFAAGLLLAGILSASLLLRQPADLDNWLRTQPSPALTAVILTIPALLGLWSLRTRSTPARRQWHGVRTGILTAAAVSALPMADRLHDRWFRGPLERMAFPEASADWEMTLTDPAARASPGSEEVRWRLHLRPPPLPDAVRILGVVTDAVAFRNGDGQPWSEWIPASGYFYFTGQREGAMIEFRCARTALPDMTRCDLRFRTTINVERRETIRLALQPNAFAAGDGWTCRVIHTGVEGAGFSYQPVLRTGLFNQERLERKNIQIAPDWNTGEALLFHQEQAQAFRTECAGFLTEFRRMRIIPKDKTAAPRPAPEYLRLTNASPRERFTRTILVQGVTLSRPEAPSPVPSVPTVRPRPEPGPRADRGGALFPRPVFGDAGPEVPDASAAEAEVADYLHWQMLPDNFRQDDSDVFIRRSYAQSRSLSGSAERKRLAALAGRFPSLFVEAVVRAGRFHEAVEALIEGAPEAAREQILTRIPECPDLVRIVTARGWESEARPHVLKLVTQSGAIPAELHALCRSYRDPAFHPFLRRQFTLDIPTIRYWQSMPDLASELPARLAEVRGETLSRAFDYEAWNALLFAGDAATLDALLALCRKDGGELEGPRSLLRHRVRMADGRALSADVFGWAAALSARSSSDFVFDPGRQVFVLKTPILTP